MCGTAYKRRLIADFFASTFELAPLLLALQAFLFGCSARAGGATFLLLPGGHGYDLYKSGQGVLLIFLLASVLLGLEYQDSLFTYPLIRQIQELFLYPLGQGGGVNIKAEMDSRCHLIDVLAASSLGTNKFELDFLLGDTYSVCNMKHA